MKEFLPTCKSLTGPNPETRRNANNQSHKVLYHKDREIWLPSEVPASFPDRAGYGVGTQMTRAWAYLHVPGQHPVVEESLLVEQAGEYDEGRHGVEDREDADANHQLLKFVRLCTVVFHDSTDTEEGDETG